MTILDLMYTFEMEEMSEIFPFSTCADFDRLPSLYSWHTSHQRLSSLLSIQNSSVFSVAFLYSPLLGLFQMVLHILAPKYIGLTCQNKAC